MAKKRRSRKKDPIEAITEITGLALGTGIGLYTINQAYSLFDLD